VRVSDGCDNRCSFCAIPLIRGGLKSRGIDDIVEECRALLERGVQEICLVAQDLAAFGFDTHGKPMLAPLLERLCGLSGDFWIRLLYLHPDHFPDILPVMQSDKRILRYFDIPFQHASPKILRLMNRKNDAAAYLRLIDTVRTALEGAVVRSTFLTGFPGETEADFRALLDFQKRAGLDWLGCFCYSREEGTPAYRIGKSPSHRTALRRKEELEAAQIPITRRRLKSLIGLHCPALIEEEILGTSPPTPSSRTAVGGGAAADGGAVGGGDGRLYIGRLWIHAPEVDGSVVIQSSRELSVGKFEMCRITGLSGFDLRAMA
jgi:ribosomal protein S12 methylthiotransferase